MQYITFCSNAHIYFCSLSVCAFRNDYVWIQRYIYFTQLPVGGVSQIQNPLRYLLVSVREIYFIYCSELMESDSRRCCG